MLFRSKNREGEKKDRRPLGWLCHCTPLLVMVVMGSTPWAKLKQREREMVRIEGEERGRFNIVNP